MLTRSQLCFLTGISSDLLKALVRRDQVPFVDEIYFAAALADTKDAHGWQRYRDADALLLILQQDLARQGGLDLSIASSIVASNAGQILSNIQNDGTEATFWIGAAFDEEGGTCGRFHVAGTLGEIQSHLDAMPLDNIRRVDRTYRLAIVNVNRALALLFERAASADPKIKLGELRGSSR